jgi:hypothetical protein
MSSITSLPGIGSDLSTSFTSVPGRNETSRTPGQKLAILRAENQAFTGRVINEVVDESLTKSREARQRAEADRAERDAQQARAAASEEEDRKRREQIEADDAQKLADRQRAETRDEEARQQSLALLTRPTAGSSSGPNSGLDTFA